MNRRKFILSTAGLGLAALCPLPSLAATPARSIGSTVQDFNSRLLGRMPAEKDLFYSPYSIAAALAMTGSGAAGATQQEFNQLLGFAGREQMISGFADLIPRLRGSEDYELITANSLWADETLPLEPAYQSMVGRRFLAQVQQVDFDGDPGGSAAKINDWASRQTRGKIKQVIQANPALRCVLANAIYFKGSWQTEFSQKLTRPAPFYPQAGSPIEVKMMQKRDRLAYAELPGLQALRLPYKGEQLAMTIFLPSTNSNLRAFEEKFRSGGLQGLAFHRRDVNAALPKFKLETDYNLEGILPSMGLKRAFSNSADFSKMSRERLKVDKVNHKAVVEVDEKGTEAAAVTTITMVRTTSVRPQPVSFRADRPFFFQISHLSTGTPLFAGRIVRPKY